MRQRARVWLLRGIVLFVFLPAAMVCLGAPVLFAGQYGAGLIDDTRALLGAGTAEGVPLVSQVSCVARTHGGGSRRLSVSDWDCVIDIAPRQRPSATPPAGMTVEQVFNENLRRAAEMRQPGRQGPGRLSRILASNREGDIPTLRRLSAEGEPPRYGIVWGVGELAGRWFGNVLPWTIIIVVGLGLLFVSWFVWRRAPVPPGSPTPR